MHFCFGTARRCIGVGVGDGVFYFIFLFRAAVRWTLLRLVRYISVDDTGAPSRGVVILCLLLTLISAWVTDFIGIDAIFGAFVAGIIVPREHRRESRRCFFVENLEIWLSSKVGEVRWALVRNQF